MNHASGSIQRESNVAQITNKIKTSQTDFWEIEHVFDHKKSLKHPKATKNLLKQLDKHELSKKLEPLKTALNGYRGAVADNRKTAADSMLISSLENPPNTTWNHPKKIKYKNKKPATKITAISNTKQFEQLETTLKKVELTKHKLKQLTKKHRETAKNIVKPTQNTFHNLEQVKQEETRSTQKHGKQLEKTSQHNHEK